MTPKSRLYFPALAGLYESLWQWVELILRVVSGLLFAAHGFWKLGFLGGPGMAGVIGFFTKHGYTPGAFWGPVITGIEVVGGILLVIGLFTRPVAAIAFIEMLFIVHYQSQYGFWHITPGGGIEYPLMWAAVLLYFLIRGGGEMSVDARMRKEF